MTREMVLEMRGVPRRRGARGRIAAAAVVALLGLLALPAAAGAVGQPGTTYSLQIGRGATETSIQRIAPDGSVSPVPAINGPGVEPLNAPVGITVDAEGYLIVADADGYEHAAYCGYVDVGGPVNPGCGAILRINPDTGATQVLSTGDKHANPYSVLLPPDGSITNGGDDSLIISDSAEGLIRLDPHAPFNAGESYMPSGTQDLSHSRGNWGLARDPVTGDILATNSGVPGVPLSGPGCETPQTTGYIARYSSDGTFERYYCDPRITAPRGIEFDSTGTAYVVDPITRNADESYGALLEITPQDQINYKAAGDLFRAPSGVAIDYSGSRLLVADEISGGGSVLAVDGFGGDQSAVAAIGSFPIDLAVDRRGAESSNLDFAIPARDPYRAHAFVGGNAFQLELMAKHRERLGVQASKEALERMAHATRRQLTTATVAVEVGEVRRADGELRFAVRVQNKTGHKFPSGYPARRAWLHVQVREGNRTVFDCGGFTEDGNVAGIADQHRQPHVNEIRRPQDVLIWEMVALDVDGEPTTSLASMATRGKDNRLLPRGYSMGGPHVDATAPVGVGSDIDFTGGGDGVQVAIPYAADAADATVIVWVHYQTIPPHWVEALRAVDADECRTYVELYDTMDKAPETIAVVVAREER